MTTEPFHWLFDPLIALSIDPYAVKPMIDQHPGLDLLNAFLFFRSVYQKHSYPSQTVILLKENEAFIFLPKFLALVSLDLRPLLSPLKHRPSLKNCCEKILILKSTQLDRPPLSF